jgi:hypothetical protein
LANNQEEGVPVGELRIRSFNVAQALQWFSCGLRLWRRRPREATVPAVLFALLVLALRAIPVLGDIVLLLLLPSFVASYLIHVHVLANTRSGPRPIAKPKTAGKPAALLWLQDLRQPLLGAWNNTANVFPLVLSGLVLVVLGLIAYALFNAVGGQAVVSPYGFFELTAVQMLRFVLAYGVAALFWLGVAMLLLWTLPLFAIRDIALAEALGLNLKALARNLPAIPVFLLVLAVFLLPAPIVKNFSWLGGLATLWLSVLLLTLAAGFSGYCSFRLVFAESETPRQS